MQTSSHPSTSIANPIGGRIYVEMTDSGQWKLTIADGAFSATAFIEPSAVPSLFPSARPAKGEAA